MMTPLTSKALDWAATVWECDPQFISQLHDVFEYPEEGKDVSVQLLHLCQGTAVDYAIDFRDNKRSPPPIHEQAQTCPDLCKS